MDRKKENELILIAARWEAICDILAGEEASDFMLSFPEIRQVADLKSSEEKWIAIQTSPDGTSAPPGSFVNTD